MAKHYPQETHDPGGSRSSGRLPWDAVASADRRQVGERESASAITAAIEQTGYRVNQHARNLATRRSKSVALLLTEPQHLLFDDPTFSIFL